MSESFAGQTVETARRALAARLKSGAIESAELDARLLVGHALGLDLTGLITSAQRRFTPDESARLEDFARRRLAALKEFSDLGAGFKIAALDLELRGAGNLLGGEQSGHIEAVGFELYTTML